MKLSLVVAMFSLTVSDAFAVSRYDITKMTCAQVQAQIEADGAVILTYRSWRIVGLPIYDSFARNQQYCPDGTVAVPVGVPTADTKYCPVKKCFASERFIAR